MYTFLSLAFSLSSIISRFLHAAVYISISFFLLRCVDMPHTRTHAHTRTRAHAQRTHVHTHTHTHAHAHTHVHTRAHARTHTRSLFIRSPIDGHSGCLAFGAVAKKAVITFVYQSLYRHMLSILLSKHWSGVTG